VVTQDDFAQDHRHYEINTAPGHHHLICHRCGEIFEFESPLTETMKQAIEAASHFEITDVRVTMQGLCPSCQGESH
jgi:Fur family ferric uptake transcriptional regulator